MTRIIIALIGLLVALPVSAQMSSSSYQIDWDNINAGGSDTGSSGSYLLRDTIGGTSIGSSTSTSYQLDSGYRIAIDDEAISFSYSAQSGSELSASSVSSTTVTVSSTGDLIVGDYVALIENLGESQVAAYGKVTSLGASSVTVDSWTYPSSLPSIDGTNDYLMEMSGSLLDFASLSDSSVSTRLIGWEITVLSNNGYTISIYEDGNLRSGANDIDDVADGTVTAGSEEYGGRSSDTSISSTTFDTADTAITSDPSAIADSSAIAFDARGYLTLKGSIDGSTESGSYAHTLTLIATGNY